MNDRDRLAADLHGEDPAFGGPNDLCGCYLMADRLIALGWTRLDEERLARALPGWMTEYPKGSTEDELARTIAQNIAKAYREDGG